MSELPERDEVRRYMEEVGYWVGMLDYAMGELKSRDEMNNEAAARMLALLVGVTMPDALAQDIAMKVVRAAWGEVADEAT